jgi:hypothetical protein
MLNELGFPRPPPPRTGGGGGGSLIFFLIRPRASAEISLGDDIKGGEIISQGNPLTLYGRLHHVPDGITRLYSFASNKRNRHYRE